MEGKLNNQSPIMQLPDPFNFPAPEPWIVWKKRFQHYLSVTGLTGKSQQEQIDILMYLMGEKSEEIMLQFPQQPDTLEKALKDFDTYFVPRRNIIFERFKFNSRVQQVGEPVDLFITDLHSLAEYCEFGAIKEELIRDRIVVGMLDARVSESLQLKPTLTLPEAVNAARQAELQRKQNKIIRDKGDYNVNLVKGRRRYTPVTQRGGSSSRGGKTAIPECHGKSGSSEKQGQQPGESSGCFFCGGVRHPRFKCPARESVCFLCKVKGHFAKVCKSKKCNWLVITLIKKLRWKGSLV
jgi:hypothetical protein